MDIQGYPGYLIYDDGRIWSSRKGKGRFLNHVKNQSGYHRIGLWGDGKGKIFTISRLVALHYIPNPENKPDVDHIDRDKDNNHVSNLRWATRQENIDNRGMTIRNTSGHTHISYQKSKNRWKFEYRKKGHEFYKSFETKKEAICFKFFFLLKLKSERG